MRRITVRIINTLTINIVSSLYPCYSPTSLYSLYYNIHRCLTRSLPPNTTEYVKECWFPLANNDDDDDAVQFVAETDERGFFKAVTNLQLSYLASTAMMECHYMALLDKN